MSVLDATDDVAETVRTQHAGVAALAIVAVFPLVANVVGGLPFITSIAIEVMIFSVFAMSFNLLVGYTGYVSFGHTVFLGSGAYVTAVLMEKFGVPFVLAVPGAIAGTAAFAFVVGAVAFRRSGVYFAMITLGVAQVFYTLFQSWDYVGGDTGIIIDPPTVLGYQFNPFEPIGYYYMALVAVVGTYLLTRSVVRSPFGHVLQAIRENEDRARAIGYDVRAFKLAVFSLSGALAALSGSLYAAYFTQVAPGSTLYWTTTGDGLFMILIGGLGTLVGPIIGAGFVIGTQYALSTYLAGFIPEGAPALLARLPERWPLLLGLLFMLTVLRFRSGIAGALGFSRVRRVEGVLLDDESSTEATESTAASAGGNEE
ncbi:branched-chain amino acid ABC transporter permease [Haloarchaeobius sp. HRN-SO-5]|uniref:branched-chain amino acid ABC transporter permease n=1 Tax=Haloarchaeobius sp. HRN-SO-5 TaxID=3446118 RepID=UPI003EBABEB1